MIREDNRTVWEWPEPNPDNWVLATIAWDERGGKWSAAYWQVLKTQIGDWQEIGVYDTREEAEHAAQLAYDMRLFLL